jgi:hypothetical protein
MQLTGRKRPAAVTGCARTSGPRRKLLGRPFWRGTLRLTGLLVLLIVLLAPASADATFTAPFFYSPAARSASAHDLALDADGDAVAAWERFDGANVRIEVRARSKAGVLRSVQTLSIAGQDADSPRVAVDATGDALVVWSRPDGTGPFGGDGCVRIQARTRSAGGVLGPVLTLSPPGQNAFEFDVAVDADGDAVAIWNRSDGSSASCCRRIQARSLSAGGALGPVQVLTASGQHADSPRVAVDADGDAVAVWTRSDGVGVRVYARGRSAGGALGPVQIISQRNSDHPLASGLAPQVAIDAAGDAVIVWQRNDGTGPCGIPGCPKIEARARSAAGVLTSVQILTNTTRGGSSPQVAMDADGDALTVWRHVDATTDCSGTGCERIQERHRAAAGGLGAVLNLSPAGQNSFFPQVGIDADGDAVAVWQREGTSNRIQARRRTAAGALGLVQTLDTAGQFSTSPHVAVAGSGVALASWERFDDLGQCSGGSSCNRVEAAVGP